MHFQIQPRFACRSLWERRSKLNREQKEKAITDLKDKFSRASAVVFTDYKGMTVAELTQLRSVLRGFSLEYSVVKNTLAKIASRDTRVSVAEDVFKGPVGIAIGYDDPVMVLKKVLEFKRTNDKLQIKGAVVEGILYGQHEIKEIAELPSREVLLSVLAAVLQSPLSKMAGILAATISSFAYAVEALSKKRDN